MSGIVGMLDLRGAPADAQLLRRMTESMAFRGPDGEAIWTDGPVGFGHTLLRTTAESATEQQPCAIDGSVWITADARIDDRRNLVRTLQSMGRTVPPGAHDAELILHAYRAWGPACVEHLLGDFAFAIWDGPARRLFCARDHFGVKPFYYARVGGCIVFSNTLDCVRLHPAVRDALNDRAIGDFLLSGWNLDTETTTFSDIRRLPPAHALAVQAGAVHQSRYWTLPTDGRIRYRRAQDYVDRFAELLRAAVGDRLRSDRIGISMSGGLDSTSIAAVTRDLMTPGATGEVRAYATVYDRLIPDEERRFAGIAADTLGIPIHYFVADDWLPFDGWDRAAPMAPEPSADPFLLARIEAIHAAALHSRVLLSGDGGDEVLRRSPLSALWRSMPATELGAAVALSLFLHGQRPDGGVRSTVRRWLGAADATLTYPSWVDNAFEVREDLRGRWRRFADPAGWNDHPLRADAYRRLTLPLWPSHLECWDPGVTRAPVEARYPFLDVRLVEHLMAIPPVPWCVNKQILRAAMRGALPEAIRLRRKTPLAGDPLLAHLAMGEVDWMDRFEPVPALRRYVDRSRVPPLSGEQGSRNPWLDVRPLCLNYWLERFETLWRTEEVNDERQIRASESRAGRQEAVHTAAAAGLR